MRNESQMLHNVIVLSVHGSELPSSGTVSTAVTRFQLYGCIE